MGSDSSEESAAPTSTTVDREVVLRATIEHSLDAVRRGIELLVWRLGLAETRADVAAQAEDALQEAVRRALDNVHTFDAHRSAHAWLLGIATNVVREQRRHLLRERQQYGGSIDSMTASSPDANTPGQFDPLSAQRIHALVTDSDQNVIELLDLVPPADREILTYRYIDQLDGRAIAAKLGIPEGRARVRLSRAVNKLTIAYNRSEGVLERDTQL